MNPQTIPFVLDRPIAFHRCFVTITDSLVAGIFLSQALYWSQRTENEEGWFFKTQTEWTDETTLSRYQQTESRNKLKQLGVLEEKLSGVPAKLFYRINLQVLANLLNELQTSTQETDILDDERFEIKDARNLQTRYQGTPDREACTPETTIKTNSIDCTPPISSPPPGKLRQPLEQAIKRYLGREPTRSERTLFFGFTKGFTEIEIAQGVEESIKAARSKDLILPRGWIWLQNSLATIGAKKEKAEKERIEREAYKKRLEEYEKMDFSPKRFLETGQW